MGPKATVPVGVATVPEDVSSTVAVQVIDWPKTIVAGEQETAMLVDLSWTVTVIAVEVLVLWVESPL